MIRWRSVLGVVAALLVAAAGARGEDAAETAYADKIFTGGVIITMDPAQPVVEAIAVAGGRIVAVGSHDAVMPLKGEATEVVDLAGKTFVLGVLGVLGKTTPAADSKPWPEPPLLAPPPLGHVFSIIDIVSVMQAYIKEHRIPEGTPIVAKGYDDKLLAERRHPTRYELDRISTRHPILIVHASGKIIIANTLALDFVDYIGPTPNPGGNLVRHDTRSEQ